MKFRRKSNIVEAVQWWPPSDSRHDGIATPISRNADFLHGQRVPLGTIFIEGGIGTIGIFHTVLTSDDWRILNPGDWIITDGQFVHCRAAKIFETSYEPIEPATEGVTP